MDDFSWGNTRLVIGEGSNKKVIMNDEEKYDESMIPLKKFSGMCYICRWNKSTDNIYRVRGRSVGDRFASLRRDWLQVPVRPSLPGTRL